MSSIKADTQKDQDLTVQDDESLAIKDEAFSPILNNSTFGDVDSDNAKMEPMSENEKKIPMSEHVLLTSLDSAIPNSSTKLKTKENESKIPIAEESIEFKNSQTILPPVILTNSPEPTDNEIIKETNENKDDASPEKDEMLQIDLKSELAEMNDKKNKSEDSEDKNSKKNPLLVAALEPKKPKIPSFCENIHEYTHKTADLDAALKNTIKKKTAPDISICQDLLFYAREENTKAIDAEEYDYASQIDEAIKLIVKTLNEDRAQYDNSHEKQQIKYRLEQVQSRESQITEEYHQKLDNHKQEVERRQKALELEHQRQIEDFQALWGSPDTMQQFSKPSSHLLQLKRQQRQLALAHDFDQAKHLKSIADELEKQETEAARARAVEAMKVAYSNLLEKQEREKECLIKNGERKEQLLESEYQKELSSNEKTKKSLQTRYASSPKNPKVTIPFVEHRGHSTRRPMSSASKVQEGPRLDVKIDFKSITKMKTPRPLPK
ncbi:hypothetical protein TVAG_417180 [Trichomonas vaginalis G3]|uniref:Uncharacterized protein n=1 Tax=Trichomonas vaginalis (strain ATCC PRA-98 / G3) TaxID=412133 RepID=A2ESH6_TRIV3|nr:hypothetical protein TVAGG3_0277770 [Trichomonas vaginalis G3]EAY04420.1 hypothetical protein TVAG_417180 [Trichomonas vaginalis G3]KAI5526323.1 hypothetical protein TVAGG3_0277770 [Trichomonas vaginalis G3]|eukprot:XP_001316643.1 hypothetical protein [Trichomonas vaginalis G3]